MLASPLGRLGRLSQHPPFTRTHRRGCAAVATAARAEVSAAATGGLPDDRPFLVRHKWAILISTAFGSWVRPAPQAAKHRPFLKCSSSHLADLHTCHAEPDSQASG